MVQIMEPLLCCVEYLYLSLVFTTINVKSTVILMCLLNFISVCELQNELFRMFPKVWYPGTVNVISGLNHARVIKEPN